MNNIKHIISSALVLILAMSLTGCSNKWLDEDPKTEMTAQKLYKDETGFEIGLNGLYSLVKQEREGYGFTDSFGATGLNALMYIAGTDTYNCGGGASGEFSAICKDWAKANVPTDKSLKSAFNWLYNTILAANTIIKYAENPDIKWDSDTSKERITAEARLVRAWAYRHLTYMWGKVPLVMTEVTGDTFKTDYVRENVSVIRGEIIKDLQYAAEHMDWKPSKIGRATKGVALAWLSEIYLAEAGTGTENLDEEYLRLAWEAANSCIEDGPYSLVRERMSNGKGSAFMDMFNNDNVNMESGNTEALWVMQWDKASTGGGNNLMRFSLGPKFEGKNKIADGVTLSYMDESRGGRRFNRTALTKWALELYDKSSDRSQGIVDQRGDEYAIGKYFVIGNLDEATGINQKTGLTYAVGDTVYIGCSKVAEAGLWEKGCLKSFAGLKSGDKEGDGSNWPYTLKYSYCDPGYPKTNESHNDQVFMRLAEVYLLRAEAAYKQGKPGDAKSDLNELRTRAHALQITDEDMDSFDIILEERARELLGEEQRLYTLRRTLNAEDYVDWITQKNGRDKNLAQRDYLFPIPQSVIDANVTLKMEQNPGFMGGSEIVEE